MARRLPGAILLFIIVLAAAALRGWRLDKIPPGLCGDEAIEALQGTALWSGEKLPELAAPRIPYPRWPVWCAVEAAATGMGGASLTASRAPAVIAGILTVLLGFYAGRILLGSACGLGTAAALAFSFWHVNYSRLGIPFHLSVGESLLIACLLLRPSSLGWKDGAAAAAVSAVAVLGYAGSLVVPIVAVLFLALRLALKRGGEREKPLALGFAAVAVPAYVLFLALTPEGACRVLDVGVAAPSGWPAQALVCFRNYFFTVPANGGFWQNYPPGAARFTAPESVLIAVGLVYLFLKAPLPRWQAAGIALWWAVSLLPEILPGGGTHLIRALPQLAPVALVMGAGAAGIARLGRGGIAAVTALYLILGAQTWDRYFNSFARDPRVMGWHNAIEARIAGRVEESARRAPVYLTPPPEYPQALLFHMLNCIKSGSIGCVREELQSAVLLEIFREPASDQPVLFMLESKRPLRGRRHIGLVNIYGLLREGMDACAAGRYGRAEEQFRSVLALAPDSAAARGYLGLALAARHRPREAIPHLRYVLKFSPEDRLFGMALEACLKGTWSRAVRNARLTGPGPF